MSRRLLLIPTGVGSGGGGGFDPTQYYTKSQIDALIADFVTASTNSLINYYLKSETYTQSEVNSLISAIETTHFEVYASLSDITNPQSNVLYLVGPVGTGSDKYEIYIYSNNQFVKIDDTSIDLSGYATLTDLQNAINTAMATLQQYALENFYQKSEVDAMIAQVETLQGIQGIAGSNGVDGFQGIQGIKGTDGINGVDGLQGIQGTMGMQGPAGGGGGSTRYDISTKSQAELADFYQNWETVMASNDVYVGTYPVTAVIPEYTVQGYTALLVEYDIKFGVEQDTTTQTPLVKGDVGAWYILPNGINGEYSANVTLPSKDYVDAVANTKQDTLTAGEGISIQGTTISATGGGGGGSAWYGTQAEFDALQNPSADVDYYISDQIKWDEIKGRPDMDNYTTKTYVDDADLVLDNKIKNVSKTKMEGTFLTQEQFQSITPKEGTNYFIEGNTVALQFTFTDNSVATYNMVID